MSQWWFCMVQKYKQNIFRNKPVTPRVSCKPKPTTCLLQLIWLKVLHQFGHLPKESHSIRDLDSTTTIRGPWTYHSYQNKVTSAITSLKIWQMEAPQNQIMISKGWYISCSIKNPSFSDFVWYSVHLVSTVSYTQLAQSPPKKTTPETPTEHKHSRTLNLTKWEMKREMKRLQGPWVFMFWMWHSGLPLLHHTLTCSLICPFFTSKNAQADEILRKGRNNLYPSAI